MGILATSFLCNISQNAGAYTTTEGYTFGEGNSQVVIGLNDSGKGCFLKYQNNGVFQKSEKGLDLGHGNGCTYYNGYYYVALGGGGINSSVIKRYDKNFNFDRQYKCLGAYDVPFNVSSITHMSGDYFIVASGTNAYVCKKYDASPGDTYYGGFVQYSQLPLYRQEVDRAFSEYTLVPQSVYYEKADKMLYRVVSYQKGSEKIRKNGIAKYSLSGGAPSYNTATFEGLYTDDQPDRPEFEMESMSADSNGQKYVAVNAKYVDEKTGNKKECDAIFKVFLQ